MAIWTKKGIRGGSFITKWGKTEQKNNNIQKGVFKYLTAAAKSKAASSAADQNKASALFSATQERTPRFYGYTLLQRSLSLRPCEGPEGLRGLNGPVHLCVYVMWWLSLCVFPEPFGPLLQPARVYSCMCVYIRFIVLGRPGFGSFVSSRKLQEAPGRCVKSSQLYL